MEHGLIWAWPFTVIQTCSSLTVISLAYIYLKHLRLVPADNHPGPQAPTAFSNGPSCVEPQADWIVDMLVSLRHCKAKRIEATREAEKKWKEDVINFSKLSLRHDVPGWYNGTFKHFIPLR